MSLRIRRGTEAQRSTITFDQGEIIYTTDSKKLYVGDGLTVGGTDLAQPLAGNGIVYNSITQKLDLSLSNSTTDGLTEGSNNKYFSAQRAQDAIGTLIAGGTQTGITVTYNSVAHALNFTVSSGIANVSADTNPSLGGNLNLNNNNITGTGNINISGSTTTTSVTASSITLNGSLSQSTGNISFTGATNAFYTTGTLTYPQINVGQLNISPSQAFGGLGGILAQTQGNTNTDAFQLFSLVTANSASAANQAFFSRSRGTLVAPTTVTAGDGILTFQYVAQSPTTQVAVAGITANASANGTISGGVVPGQLVFQTANASGTLTTGLTIDGPTNSVNIGTYLTQSITATITAQGSNQAGALALTTNINVVTTVTTNSGVALPAAVAGMIITVYNAGANPLNIYTVSGGSAKINALSTTAAYSLAIGTGIRFLAVSATQWYTI